MASSVARMPAEEWQDPGRLAAGVLGAHHPHPSFSAKNLRKVLVPERAQPTPSSPSTAVDRDNNPTATEPSSPAARRRQSQILDRWAAQQAREMITTIERQAHEAELSALSTTAQPVSTRAASFLRETSPALSDSSACSSVTAASAATGDCGSSGIGLPSNVRASSLIQMWRELEAEAGVTSTPRSTSGCNNSGGNNAMLLSSAEEPSGISGACDDSEAFGDWDSEAMASSERANCSLPESEWERERERGRVENIVKMLSSGSTVQSSAASSWCDETDPLVRENLASDHRESLASSRGAPLRVRGRREIEDLLTKIGQERRRELDRLVERQPVSQFAHRGRIQSVLRFMSLRRELAAQDQPRPASRTFELDQLQKGATILSLRQRFNHRGQHDGCGETAAESSSSLHVQFPDNSQESGYACKSNQLTTDNNQYEEVVSPRDSEDTTPEVNSPQSRSEDLHEGSRSIDGSWDERSLWVSNLDWQRPVDSSTSHSWQDEVVTEELESYTQQDVGNTGTTWLSDSPNSWRALSVSRQAMGHDVLENFSDNAEIRELLERRRVSTSLASDFREKMNRLIGSFLQRQEQHFVDENTADEEGERFGWRQNNNIDNADQVASASSSLVPLPYRSMYNSESWHDASFVQNSSHHLLEMEAVEDLRTDMAHIQHEIYDLRKLVESCMDWQAKLQHSAKQGISNAVHQSVIIEDGSKWPQTRKGSCCICCEMQVDSLLYRCGHMCTCFKCAHELQWSSARCPICRAPIVDVVRAYSNS